MIKQYNGAKAQRRAAREILPKGGYVAKILDAKVQNYDFGDKLVLAFDVAEGPYNGFFSRDFSQNPNEDKKWRGTVRLSIPKDDGSERDEWSKNSFNAFIWAIEDSNPGYTWAWDETTLKGKTIGVLFRNKEWEFGENRGWTTECCAVEAASVIREGKYKQPKDKPLSAAKKCRGSGASAQSAAAAPSGFASVDDDDGTLPF